MVPLPQAYSQMVFFSNDSGKTNLGRGGEDICTDTCEVTLTRSRHFRGERHVQIAKPSDIHSDEICSRHRKNTQSVRNKRTEVGWEEGGGRPAGFCDGFV